MSGENYPRALKNAVKIADALKVSVDYLLGITDVMTPREKSGELSRSFDEKYSYLYDDVDFLKCVEVYKALCDKDKKCMTEIVRLYGINRKVLGENGEIVSAWKTGVDI